MSDSLRPTYDFVLGDLQREESARFGELLRRPGGILHALVPNVANVSVVRRRIDFTLVAVERKTGKSRVEPSPRAGIAQRKRAGREVERAQVHQAERGAPRRGAAGAGGKLRLGVSHRGMRDEAEGGGGGGRRKKAAGGHKHKRKK